LIDEFVNRINLKKYFIYKILYGRNFLSVALDFEKFFYKFSKRKLSFCTIAISEQAIWLSPVGSCQLDLADWVSGQLGLGQLSPLND
jgi:hypothetical protein